MSDRTLLIQMKCTYCKKLSTHRKQPTYTNNYFSSFAFIFTTIWNPLTACMKFSLWVEIEYLKIYKPKFWWPLADFVRSMEKSVKITSRWIHEWIDILVSEFWIFMQIWLGFLKFLIRRERYKLLKTHATKKLQKRRYAKWFPFHQL